MSTIITANSNTGRFELNILASESNTIITCTDFEDWMIRIDGEANHPFISGVRFIGCSIIAESMSAFIGCLFDDCEMIIKNYPLAKANYEFVSINNNKVVTRSEPSNHEA